MKHQEHIDRIYEKIEEIEESPILSESQKSDIYEYADDLIRNGCVEVISAEYLEDQDFETEVDRLIDLQKARYGKEPELLKNIEIPEDELESILYSEVEKMVTDEDRVIDAFEDLVTDEIEDYKQYHMKDFPIQQFDRLRRFIEGRWQRPPDDLQSSGQLAGSLLDLVGEYDNAKRKQLKEKLLSRLDTLSSTSVLEHSKK